MKINETQRFVITLLMLPWLPSFLLYKHSHRMSAILFLSFFILLFLLCIINKNFTQKLMNLVKTSVAFLGKYIAMIVLVCGFFFVVVPIGFLAKLFKRDRLKLKKRKADSYWLNYENTNMDYEYQF